MGEVVRLRVQERFCGGFAFKAIGRAEEQRRISMAERAEEEARALEEEEESEESVYRDEELEDLEQEDMDALDKAMRDMPWRKPENKTGQYRQPGKDLRCDKERDDAIAAAMNPKRVFNASFTQIWRTQDWTYQNSRDPQAIPAHYFVTGHKVGGNIGINGIYERWVSDFEGRPVFRKILEKREIGTGQSQPREHPRMMGTYDGVPGHFDMIRSGGSVPTKLLKKVDPQKTEISWVQGAYWLYYQCRVGSWLIGPHVGSHGCFAKHYCAEEAMPFMMSSWEVWDCGKHEWRDDKTMRVYKCGTAAAPPDASLMRVLPPDWPMARLPHDQW